MAVVCDTSPLSYLILIGEADVFGTLSGDVRVPPAVEQELRHPDGPAQVRRWIEEAPSWLQVEEPPKGTLEDASSEAVSSKTAEAFGSLDRGERQAIRLARGIEAGLLVIDERDGRRVAKRLGLSVTGTIGVMDSAAAEGLVDASDVAERLRGTSFRAGSDLYQWLVNRHS